MKQTVNYEEMSEKELLAKMAKDTRAMRVHSLIRTAAVCGIFVIAAVLSVLTSKKVFPVLSSVKSAAESVEEAAEILDELKVSAEESLRSVETMTGSATKMIEENTKNVEDAFNNFNSIDFETLNKAISDLSEVVEPLARFASNFRF